MPGPAPTHRKSNQRMSAAITHRAHHKNPSTTDTYGSTRPFYLEIEAIPGRPAQPLLHDT